MRRVIASCLSYVLITLLGVAPAFAQTTSADGVWSISLECGPPRSQARNMSGFKSSVKLDVIGGAGYRKLVGADGEIAEWRAEIKNGSVSLKSEHHRPSDSSRWQIQMSGNMSDTKSFSVKGGLYAGGSLARECAAQGISNDASTATPEAKPTTGPQAKSAKPTASKVLANRKALVIGNDSYTHVPKLNNARADAKAIADGLTKVGYQVTLKLDLTEKDMKSAIRNFKAQVEGGDEVAIFYAGHGVQLANTNFLLPVDVTGEGEEQVKDEAIALQRLLDDMAEKKVKFTLAVIDACRDNPFKVSGRAIGGRGLASTTAATGQMIVFSAGTGQQALDSLGPNDKDRNGLFTRVFVKQMDQPGVTIDRIVRGVRTEVVTLAKSVGHEQVPAIYDQVVGEFYFKQ